jgi:two-component system sensor histidine kinase UhpB
MSESATRPEPSPLTYQSPWRDLAVVIAITTLSMLCSDYFNLNEALYAFTRGGERLQIDELPIGMLVLLICLMWLSWRRYVHARREIAARRTAEERLGAALAENRRLAQENLRIQEVERKHLARELHDELGQYLNAIKIDAVAIRENGATDAGFSTNASVAIIRTVDHVHAAVGDMIARLRPVALDELGLVAALEHCVDYWRHRVPNTRFVLTVHGSFDDLSEPLNLTLYRLIQEGLTNIYKHANAKQATISLERIRSIEHDRGELFLAVADDGCGMESSSRTSRFGLSGMRERVEMAGGTFKLESAPGRGLRFEAHLPTDGEM